MRSDSVVWFKDVEKEDVRLVGGKGANLGEMTRAGFPVPPGFIVTVNAYFSFLKENNFEEKISALLKKTRFDDSSSLKKTSQEIRNLILKGKISEKLTREVFSAYKMLGGVLSDALVAVRSSATAEDLPNASFAGQQETFLNVKGEANVLLKIKEAWASLFNARAIFYRHEQNYDKVKVGIAIPVQKMVESEKSGIMFTVDPLTNDKTKIVIEAIFGLGELIVQGEVTPDHYEVSKKLGTISEKRIAIQPKQLIKKGTENKLVILPLKKGKLQKITHEQILALALIGKAIEKHYYFPQDIEWAIEKGHIYIVQTRPVTTMHETKKNGIAGHIQHMQILLTGDPASPGIASGPVKILTSAAEIHKIAVGDVLVAPETNPDFVPAMKKACAIVTDRGGRTSHAAIVSREIGIPAVVGTEQATKKLTDGLVITVNGSKGEIYKGAFQNIQNKTTAGKIQTATKLYVNLAEPEFAERTSSRDVDGVGLLRAEFMMAGIGIHPKKLIEEGKKKLFVEKMVSGMEQFCKAFYPRPVVYRTSDFKTNEYRHLTGGAAFEPQEPNPLLGFRGAYRYIHDADVFMLELEAIRYVREKLGQTNLWVMLPFVRRVEDFRQVKTLLAKAGLHRSPSFKIWLMVEIPSNVILLEQFIDAGIDGVSIGSNDLTMLLLGADRDNNLIAEEFDEMNDAVLWAYEKVIKTCHTYKITSSICGQAVSTYPKLVEALVRWGITSVSVSPDAIEVTRELLSQTEKKLFS